MIYTYVHPLSLHSALPIAANFEWWSTLPALKPTSLIKTWGLAPALIANLTVFALIAWGATVLEKRRHGHVISFASRTSRPVSLLQGPWPLIRSEEHTSELQSLMRNSYAVFCLKKKK